MQSIENKINSRIYGHKRGWCFSKVDFLDIAPGPNIHQALSSLSKAGRIRRVLKGVYDYPRFSDGLNRDLSPDVDQVALALARKFNWRVQPSGDVALNLLGLSTQVPGRWIYLSDGPSRRYSVGEQLVCFEHRSLRNVGFKHRQSGLLVQALHALGQERIDERVIRKIRDQFDASLRAKVLKDTRTVTAWVYDSIVKICREE